MKTTELGIWLYGRRAGTLQRTSADEFHFKYEPTYARDAAATPLSTTLPLRKEPYGTEESMRWFSGLLPEKGRREELQALVGARNTQTWTLLAAAGIDCAGAVQVIGDATREQQPWLDRLEGTEIQALLRREAHGEPDKRYRDARISLAGAQPKIALYRDSDGTWAVPRDGYPSTHILKPDTGWFREMVANEHWCMTVARYAGIEAATTAVWTIGRIETLVIRRYDREYTTDGVPTRLHQEDLVQALGFDTEHKYEAYEGPTSIDLFGAPGVNRETLFDRMVFNWIVGNCDAHAKNYSILEPGTTRARLSPAYDVMSSECYDLPQRLATSIGGVTVLNAVTEEAIEALGDEAGLDGTRTRARTHTVVGRCREAIARCRNEGISNGPVDAAAIGRRIDTALGWWNGVPGYAGALTPAERALQKMLNADPREESQRPAIGGDLPRRAPPGRLDRKRKGQEKPQQNTRPKPAAERGGRNYD